MTEAEWFASVHPMPMLEFLEGRGLDRPLRRFAIACCREGEVWHRLNWQSRSVVDAAGEVADAAEEWAALLAAARMAPRGVARVGSGGGLSPMHISLTSQAERAVLALALDNAWEAAWQVARLTENLLEAAVCDILREVVAYPNRSYPRAAELPEVVGELARRFAEGHRCRFALYDALLDAGQEYLAAHFRQDKHHLKGCWALAVLLGKE